MLQTEDWNLYLHFKSKYAQKKRFVIQVKTLRRFSSNDEAFFCEFKSNCKVEFTKAILHTKIIIKCKKKFAH